MICLAVDTTSQTLVLALVGDGVCKSKSIYVGKSGHSAILMQEIDNLLCENKVSIDNVGAVAVVVGPGSFTGIRIGVSSVTALAFATGAKRIAVTTFDLLAYNRTNATLKVDAGHGNWYTAAVQNGKIVDIGFAQGDDPALDDAVCEPVCGFEQALVEVCKLKLQNEEFVGVLEPMYIRRSQAEREKDEV